MFRSFLYIEHAPIPRASTLSNTAKQPYPRLSVVPAITSGQIGKCFLNSRSLHTQPTSDSPTAFGKQLKEEFKSKRLERRAAKKLLSETRAVRAAELSKWELTVGLELHVQLNTEAKLFSASRTSVDTPPNTNVSFFDLALPGSQPIFQTATLIPALRAAIALQCRIQKESTFDRKHYFYPDQPAGYQITQYYKPFAEGGQISLQSPGLIEPTENDIVVGIKQIQLEQDTAKSTSQSPSATLVDFNRVGHPLIEIITLPEIHSPEIAAACARKIQSILQSVNAVFTGMEMGGLRVDVNVSVSPKGSKKLGQRTEIKNLSSFRAIEQAIIAERDRQIDILENGGSVAGETRGWVLGSTSTTKLRDKEGEVDYRYMPDPDISPLLIDESLIVHIRNTLPSLPDQIVRELHSVSGLEMAIAKILLSLDGGQRVDYFDAVCAQLYKTMELDDNAVAEKQRVSRIVANWVIYEVGGPFSSKTRPFSPSTVPPTSLARILEHLLANQITGTSAKRLLLIVFLGDKRDVDSIIETEGMKASHISEHEYQAIAGSLVAKHPKKVAQIQNGKVGKVKFLVGLMMKNGNGNLNAVKAENALRAVLKL